MLLNKRLPHFPEIILKGILFIKVRWQINKRRTEISGYKTDTTPHKPNSHNTWFINMFVLDTEQNIFGNPSLHCITIGLKGIVLLSILLHKMRALSSWWFTNCIIFRTHVGKLQQCHLEASDKTVPTINVTTCPRNTHDNFSSSIW